MRVEGMALEHRRRSGLPAVGAAPSLVGALALGAAASWFGVLHGAGRHPTLKLGGALTLAVLGGGLVLLTRLRQRGETRSPPRGNGVLVGDVIRTVVALLSMDAALIHFAVIPQHLDEYWLYGGFFVLVALAQIAWGIFAVVDISRPLLWLGAVGNALVAGVWILTRTYGALIGPDATEPARAGFGDIVSTIMELTIAGASIALLLAPLSERSERTQAGDVASGFAALVTSAFTVLALFSAVGGPPFVSRVG